jgi:uncharacterized protein (DUF2141 family)
MNDLMTGTRRRFARMRRSLIVLLLAVLASAASEQSGQLEITVTNVQDARGQLLVAVSNNADTWLSTAKDEPPFRYAIHEVRSKGNAVVLIRGLPAGDYGVSLFHDLNGDSKMDTNFIGYPKEPFGFSAPMGLFGPPNFDKAKVAVNQNVSTVVVELN